MPHRTHDTTLIEVRGDLVLAALCVGQFRAPCQIEADRLIVLAGEPLTQALNALGLVLSATEAESFTPAPMFAPDSGHGGRHVHTHVSRHHDEAAADEDDSRGSNA